ncbi:MAG: AMP-binding protein, partial [Solimonas sp.]
AFVIPEKDPPFDEASVLSYVRNRLAAFKVPVRVFPIDAFPVTPGANATKIQKGRLRELAEALLN